MFSSDIPESIQKITKERTKDGCQNQRQTKIGIDTKDMHTKLFVEWKHLVVVKIGSPRFQ